MKKRLVIFLMLMFFTVPGFAELSVSSVPLYDTDGTLISAYALTSGSAVTTKKIDVSKNTGFFTLVVTENKVGGAGDVDIYAEYSDDGDDWSRPYISDMAGTATVEGNIVNAVQNVTARRYVFTARLANYVRFVLDPDADSQVTIRLIFQQDFN